MQLKLRDAETFQGGECMKTRGGIQLEAFNQILFKCNVDILCPCCAALFFYATTYLEDKYCTLRSTAFI